MTLRSLLRQAYGVRLRLLHMRAALWSEAKELNGEAFCWTGRLKNTGSAPRQKTADDHTVDVMAVAMRRGVTDMDELMRIYQDWTHGGT